MSTCWHCHWGWPKKIAAIYHEALNKLDGHTCPLDSGPATLVWSGENFAEAEWCLAHFFGLRIECDGNISVEEFAIVKWSLEELIKVPLIERDIVPKDYDGAYPENYPPAEGTECENPQCWVNAVIQKFPTT